MREATGEGRSEAGVTGDGRPSKVLSPGYGHNGHTCVLLTLENNSRRFCATRRFSQGYKRGRRSGCCVRGPCHRTGKEKNMSPSLLAPAAASGRPRLFREGRGRSAMCLDEAVLRGLPPGRCSWRGGAELRATLQRSH